MSQDVPYVRLVCTMNYIYAVKEFCLRYSEAINVMMIYDILID
jgi:hypothetical protein